MVLSTDFSETQAQVAAAGQINCAEVDFTGGAVPLVASAKSLN